MNANALRYGLNWIRGMLRERQEKRAIADADWRRICRENSIPFDMVRLTPDDALVIHLTHSSVTLPKIPAAFGLLSGYSLLHDMEAYTGCRIKWDEQSNALKLHWGNAAYLADCFEELYILREIYFAGDYDFCASESTVVVDVGANVGFTSIFLAEANPDIVVIGCEPVPVNYAKALINLAGNPQLSHRISLHNLGLFSEDGERTIASTPGDRVRSSIVTDKLPSAQAATEFIRVTVRRASGFIREVSELHPHRRIVIKMDCEGSEYHILRDLEAGGTLGLIGGFIMEWHRLASKGDDAAFIRTLFKRSGFDVCMLGRLQSRDDVGMAYAFRVASGPA